MINVAIAFPRLDFEGFSLAFPERGQSGFLTFSDLTRLQQTTAGAREGAWLFRSESGSCGIIPFRTRVLRESVLVVGIAVLHHLDQLEIGNQKARFCELGKILLNASHHLTGRSCPFCHDRLADGQEVYRCPLCGEAYCLDCWAELNGKRCCTRSCRFSPGDVLEM